MRAYRRRTSPDDFLFGRTPPLEILSPFVAAGSCMERTAEVGQRGVLTGLARCGQTEQRSSVQRLSGNFISYLSKECVWNICNYDLC